MKPDLRTREAKAAMAYMESKGYELKPHEVYKIEGQPCWYFYFPMDAGLVELEVFWEEQAWQYKSQFIQPLVSADR